MSYNYQIDKEQIFTEEGLVTFLKIRDRTLDILIRYGSVMMEDALKAVTGNNWFHMACVDHMVTLGDIVEVIRTPDTPGQYRIFTKPI